MKQHSIVASTPETGLFGLLAKPKPKPTEPSHQQIRDLVTASGDPADARYFAYAEKHGLFLSGYDWRDQIIRHAAMHHEELREPPRSSNPTLEPDLALFLAETLLAGTSPHESSKDDSDTPIPHAPVNSAAGGKKQYDQGEAVAFIEYLCGEWRKDRCRRYGRDELYDIVSAPGACFEDISTDAFRKAWKSAKKPPTWEAPGRISAEEKANPDLARQLANPQAWAALKSTLDLG